VSQNKPKLTANANSTTATTLVPIKEEQEIVCVPQNGDILD